MRIEILGDAAVFRAGRGAACNAPGGDLRDMGEEATSPLPPSPWHGQLDAALAAQSPTPRRVVVDVSEMARLVVEDLGFLLRLATRQAQRGVRVALLASPHVARTISLLGLDGRLPVRTSLEDVLRA